MGHTAYTEHTGSADKTLRIHKCSRMDKIKLDLTEETGREKLGWANLAQKRAFPYYATMRNCGDPKWPPSSEG